MPAFQPPSPACAFSALVASLLGQADGCASAPDCGAVDPTADAAPDVVAVDGGHWGRLSCRAPSDEE